MSLRDTFAAYLPLNRKERFYTGTVLPMIVAKENFRHLPKLLSLLHISNPPDIRHHVDTTNIQFFTEYSLLESIVPSSQRHFHDLPKSKDTPDVIILLGGPPKILIALEAKMFDLPNQDELNEQLDAQGKVLESIRKTLDIQQVFHFALLPEMLAKKMRGLRYPIISWETIVEAYGPICKGDYFYELLCIALQDYEKLIAGEISYGKNCEEHLSGKDIYDRFKEGKLDGSWMGRQGGLRGEKLERDLASGKWRSFKYETRSSPVPESNRNWFQVGEFVKLIEESESRLKQ